MPKVSVLPTRSIVRAYAVATGSLSEKAKVTKAATEQYLRDHPAEARALLNQAGLRVGKRGVISAEQFSQAADLVK